MQIEAGSVTYVVGSLNYTHKTTITDVFNTIDEAVATGARFTADDAARIQRELDEIAYWAKRMTEQVKANTLV